MLSQNCDLRWSCNLKSFGAAHNGVCGLDLRRYGHPQPLLNGCSLETPVQIAEAAMLSYASLELGNLATFQDELWHDWRAAQPSKPLLQADQRLNTSRPSTIPSAEEQTDRTTTTA